MNTKNILLDLIELKVESVTIETDAGESVTTPQEALEDFEEIAPGETFEILGWD